ncbi:uncharacterized protein LOC144357058, partial [Saccoglossus kowalevskii]
MPPALVNAEARASRKTIFHLKSLSGADRRGSKGGLLRVVGRFPRTGSRRLESNPVKNMDSDLSENDIPGASLNGRNPARLCNDELRFWLLCCGDRPKQNMTKAELIARVNHFIVNKLDKKIVDPDPNNVYTKQKIGQTEYLSTSTSTSAAVSYPQSGWGTSLENLPLFSRARMDVKVATGGKTLHKEKKKTKQNQQLFS